MSNSVICGYPGSLTIRNEVSLVPSQSAMVDALFGTIPDPGTHGSSAVLSAFLLQRVSLQNSFFYCRHLYKQSNQISTHDPFPQDRALKRDVFSMPVYRLAALILLQDFQ